MRSNRYLRNQHTPLPLLTRAHTSPLAPTKKAMMRSLGCWGFGQLKASLSVKYWNADTGMMIVRLSRDHFREGWYAICSMTELREKKCVLSVLHVGGTIRVVKRNLLRYQMEQHRAAISSVSLA